MISDIIHKKIKIEPSLKLYDFLIFIMVDILLFVLYRGAGALDFVGVLEQSIIAFGTIFGCRHFGRIYGQIWRYGGIQCYIRMFMADGAAFLIYLLVAIILPVSHIAVAKLLAFCCVNTLGSITIRMFYHYAYKYGGQDTRFGEILRWSLKVFSGGRVQTEPYPDSQKIKIAIIGAGTVGVELAEDLAINKKSRYAPCYFIDNSEDKIGRNLHGLDVLDDSETTLELLKAQQIRVVVLAIPDMDNVRRTELYDYYRKAGFVVKIFDYPAIDTPGQRRQLRNFNIDDLLLREQRNILNENTRAYYQDKVILITGGGGSIGSELCRQLAKMEPKQLIILDVYENCAYDLQQSILFNYKGKVDIKIEIASIRDKKALERCFQRYRPDICINAAAHKHVPFMENNCIEAVENNVFGCLNVIEACEKFSCNRFIMVSTDKAVNPTSVMGATKRVCEMIMQAYSTKGTVKCSATRFGNVLGSAGSVIPLFKRQIAAGGPVTVTDRRVIRYFMTIPEASQLVLTSGAMANNGEIFILDMGKPVKIWELAENMVAMSGMDVEIIEIGLRPGEKLYEELLVGKNNLVKTDNDLIFIDHENPVNMSELKEKLATLKAACSKDSDEAVREGLRSIVPTYRRPEVVNKEV